MRARTVIALVIVAPGAIVLATLVTFLATGLLITAAGPAPHARPAADGSRRLHRSHAVHRERPRPSR